VLPRILDLALSERTTGQLRERVCAGLTGEVVEIGFGSGGNVLHYPAAVTGVAAVEPSDVAWQIAEQRLRATTVPVRRSDVDGQRLSASDGAFDSALSTRTLCTIPDVAVALAELHRVLKPGGDAALRRARPGAGRAGATLAAIDPIRCSSGSSADVT
jgi:ubiquinone/menaquinone biosynthesis C-methylase UbiE